MGFRSVSAWAGRAGRVAATAGVLLLSVALAAHAARSAREDRDLAARAEALDRELLRLRERNRDLREEVRALREDPVYVETVLRSWKRAGAGERVVE